MKVKKSDDSIKVYLYSDITDFNEITIKDIGLIPHQQTVFYQMEGAK